MPEAAGSSATAPADAWQRIWGPDLGAVRPGSADHALMQGWWLGQLAGLPKMTHALEIGAGAMPLPSSCLIELNPDVQLVVSDFRECGDGHPGGPIRVGNAPIEALPFADASFDLLLSQFAFEYAEPVAAAREIRRVLRPGGRAILALHDGDGFFAGYLVHRIACLVAGVGIAATISARPLAREVRHARLRKSLRQVGSLLETYLSSPTHRDVADDLIDLRGIIETALAGRAADAGQQLILDQVEPALFLARAQLAAGYTAHTIATLVGGLEQAGFADIAVEPIASATHGIAWGVSAVAR